MGKIYSKNSIISLILVVCIISMPLAFFPTKKAQAQSIYSRVGSISSLVTQMPGCKDMITSGIKSLFSSSDTGSGNGPDFSGGKDFGIPNGPTSSSSLSAINDYGVSDSTDVSVSDKATQQNTAAAVAPAKSSAAAVGFF